jgi:hypothetical protein
MSKFTKGPWRVGRRLPQDDDLAIVDEIGFIVARVNQYAESFGDKKDNANARLIAAAPEMYAEMLKHLPILERAEADPEIWEKLTARLGIATLNGYRAILAKVDA